MPPLKRLPVDEVVALAEPRDEWLELGEVVAVVGVAHDHPAPARGRDPARERGAVSAALDRHDPGAELLRDLLRAVRRAVVGDDDLAGDAEALEGVLRLADADPERPRLVQARHDDRELRHDLSPSPGKGRRRPTAPPRRASAGSYRSRRGLRVRSRARGYQAHRYPLGQPPFDAARSSQELRIDTEPVRRHRACSRAARQGA